MSSVGILVILLSCSTTCKIGSGYKLCHILCHLKEYVLIESITFMNHYRYGRWLGPKQTTYDIWNVTYKDFLIWTKTVQLVFTSINCHNFVWTDNSISMHMYILCNLNNIPICSGMLANCGRFVWKKDICRTDQSLYLQYISLSYM